MAAVVSFFVGLFAAAFVVRLLVTTPLLGRLACRLSGEHDGVYECLVMRSGGLTHLGYWCRRCDRDFTALELSKWGLPGRVVTDRVVVEGVRIEGAGADGAA